MNNANASWLYRHCLTYQSTNNTNTAHDKALPLARSTLQIIQNAPIVDGEWVHKKKKAQCQMSLFKLVKDKNFVFGVMGKMVELKEDGGLSVESLKAAAAAAAAAAAQVEAAAGDDIDDVHEKDNVTKKNTDNDNDKEDNQLNDHGDIHENGGVQSQSVQLETHENTGETAHTPLKSAELTYNDALTSKDDGYEQHNSIDSNELHRFQLRTKVLGLAQPSFTAELWKYLQKAGWTYGGGSYRPPKAKQIIGTSNYSDSLKLAKRIFREAGDTNNSLFLTQQQAPHQDTNDSDSEEGPEVFDSSNAIIDYLDQYCLPDYTLTPSQVQEREQLLSKHSQAYQRRCKRLRYELLEIAYRERSTRQHDFVEKDGRLKSKYGHNHRPCEVCFGGSSVMYPRVACRDCGLVVHTNCYGLRDFDEGNTEKIIDAQNNRQDAVDSKGFFQCDVCRVGLTEGSISKKTLWEGPQWARWRAYSHPAAVCRLCDYQFIAGGMVQVNNDADAVSGDAAGGGKKRRRSREQTLEIWVHIHCYNAVTGMDYTQMAQSAAEVIRQIGNASLSTPHYCCYCPKQKGWTKACKNKEKCGNYFHSICLQLEHAKSGRMDGKMDICIQCSTNNTSSGKSTDHSHSETAIIPSELKVKSNTAGHAEYFKRPRKKKGPKEENVQSKDVITIPPIKKIIHDAQSVFAAEQCEEGYNTHDSQYNTQFREWSFSLSIGQCVLLHGLGSKRSVLEAFGDSLAEEGNVITINGYDDAMNLTAFFDIMVEMVSPDDEDCDRFKTNTSTENEIRRGWVKKAFFIAEQYSEDSPLFLLIHNIDGEKLSSSYAQDALATLTANSMKNGLPMIRIAASIDDVNRSMFWNPQIEHKFNWVWKLVHTYRPHLEEFSKGPKEVVAKKTKQIRQKARVLSAKSVLLSLAPKHKEVVMLLAKMQSRKSTVTYRALKAECGSNMIVAVDSVLRSILKELKDHSIVEYGSTGDSWNIEETVRIPSDEMMHEILAS